MPYSCLKNIILLVFLLLFDIDSYYRSVEDYKNAFLISKNISLLTDSITEMQNQTQLLLLDVKFETGNKIRKITALESENLYKQKLLRQQRIIYAVIIFLLCMVIYFVRNNFIIINYYIFI